MTLEDVLANQRGEAAVLRARGLTARADDIERVCDEIASALPHYLSWLSESEAALWSGQSRAWLRDRRDGWGERGDARKQGRGWFYRASALPRRADLVGAAVRARRMIAA